MADADAAALTLGIAIYAAAILIGTGLVVNAVTRHRKNRAIAAAVVVLVLVVAGVVVAVASSIS
ncbi:hypothetical protein ACPXCG_01535 [Gordonia sp. DT218]